MKKINCLIGVILIEMLYIINELIWQKVCVLAKNKVFSISFFKRKHWEYVLAPTQLLNDMQNNMNNNVCKNDIGATFDKLSAIEFEEKLMNSSCFWEIAEKSPFTWRHRSDVVKLINFCSLHIQFYVWLKYLYNRMFFSNL